TSPWAWSRARTANLGLPLSRTKAVHPLGKGPKNATSAKSAKVAKSPFIASFGPLTRETDTEQSLKSEPSRSRKRAPGRLVRRAWWPHAHRGEPPPLA